MGFAVAVQPWALAVHCLTVDTVNVSPYGLQICWL